MPSAAFVEPFVLEGCNAKIADRLNRLKETLAGLDSTKIDDINALLGSDYIRCSSSEQDENVYSGRVTEYLDEHPSLNPGLKYYICGNAEMVVDTRDILINKGIPFDHIISEIYF